MTSVLFTLTLTLTLTPCIGVGKSVSQQVSYDIATTQLRVKGCDLTTVRGKMTLEERKGQPPLYVWTLEADSLPRR